ERVSFPRRFSFAGAETSAAEMRAYPLRTAISILLLCCVASLWAFEATISGSIAGDVHDGSNAHLKIPNPAELRPERAEEIYQSIRESMARNYAESSDPLAETHQHWVRANRFPHPSAAHGGIYINT